MKYILFALIAFNPAAKVWHGLHFVVEKTATFYVNHVQRMHNPKVPYCGEGNCSGHRN